MSKNKKITGKMFIRDFGDAGRYKPGHRIVLLMALVAIPEDEMPQDESFAVVRGDMEGNIIALTAIQTGEQHLDQTIGSSPSGILRAPIWQV